MKESKNHMSNENKIMPTANDPLAPLTASLRCEGSGSPSLTTFEVKFDILYQGEGRFERTAVMRISLEADVSGFLDPQDVQTILEVLYRERIIQPTSIVRV